MIPCRACSLQTTDFTSVYSKVNNATLAQMLQTLVPVQIPEHDEGILTVMCADCIKHTIEGYQFVQAVLRADRWWESKLSQMDPNTNVCETASETITLKIEPAGNLEEDALDDIEYLSGSDEDSDLMSDTKAVDEETSKLDVDLTSTSCGLKHVLYFPQLANGDSYFRCCGSKCLLTFGSREALERHGATEHGIGQRAVPWDDSFQYECTVCFRRFEHRKNLLTHLRRLVRDFQCPVCAMCFDRPRQKVDHMHQLHAEYLRRVARKTYRLEEQPVKICCGCEERFATIEELLAHGRERHTALHEQKHDGSEEKPSVRCNVCHKVFKSQASLRNHQRSVYQEKPFSCGQCGEAFSFSSQLETHQQVHAVERNFVCETCGATLKTKVGLSAHVATHREKTLRCTECDYRTMKQSRLQTHMRRHSDEMPFACQQCPKRFRAKSNLVSHMRSHSDERSYQCRYCFRRYVYVSDRAKHERTHTGDIPYGCDDCGKKFVRPCMLKAHRRACKKASFPTALDE